MNKKSVLLCFGFVLACFAGASMATGGSDLSAVAQDACNKAQQARHDAGERKKQEYEQVFQNTIGQKLQRVAQNCAEALKNATVPYVNASPGGIIDALLNAANSACMQVAGKVQQQQQQALGAFNKTLPYGMGGIHTKSIKIGNGGTVGWNPVDIRGLDGQKIDTNGWN